MNINNNPFRSKKALHLVKEFGPAEAAKYFNDLHTTGKAVEPKPKVRKPFNPAEDPGPFRAEQVFSSEWETSNFFDLFLPEGVKYVEVTARAREENELEHNTNWFDHIAQKGYQILGTTHHVLYGDWNDDGIAILVPADQLKSLEDLGLHLTIHGEADKLKVRKYFRRVRAHHEWAIRGSVFETQETATGTNLIIGVSNGEESINFNMLHVDLSTLNSAYDVAIADGIHLIDVELCRTLGRMFGIEKLIRARVGDCFKGTALSILGLGKGFFHVITNPQSGITLYGPKKQVTFDYFFLGSLGDVKAGDAYTDLQSMINFDYWDNDLAFNNAMLFTQEVVNSINDEKAFRHLALNHMAPMSEMLQNEGDREGWILLEALRKGVSLKKNPALRRRVIRHLFVHVLNTQKGRIPLMSVGARFHAQPDLNCFLQDGTVDYRLSVIPISAVCNMDLNQGPMAMFRQPSGHKKELVSTTNIHNRRFRRFIGRNRVIMGPSALEYLKIMGGGDMDDPIIATDNIDWIEVMATGDYPEAEFPKVSEAQRVEANKKNKFRRSPISYPRVWAVDPDFFDATARAKEIGLNLGALVNAIMKDELLSGVHKENMLAWLADQIVDAPEGDFKGSKTDLKRRYDILRARPNRKLRIAARELEAFVDHILMGKGDPLQFQSMLEAINEVRNEDNIVPQLFLITDADGNNRLTKAVNEAHDYIAAPSMVCDTLNRIKEQVDMLQEALTEEEWFNVDSIPETLNQMFPRDRAFREEAIDLRQAWGDHFRKRTVKDLSIVYKSALEDVVRPALNQWNGEGGDDIKTMLAVEHARLTYRGRKTVAERNQDGTVRSYPDGLLWTNAIGAYYIKALDEAGLTGLYVPVQFDHWSRNYRRGTWQVSVSGGVVTLHDSGLALGTTMSDGHEDGNFVMEDGMITVREPADEMIMDRAVVDATFSNPVDDGFYPEPNGYDEDLEFVLNS